MVSVCLPSDALLQHLPSYLGFSYLGHGVSLHGCSSKAQPLLLTLDEGYLLTAAFPDLQKGQGNGGGTSAATGLEEKQGHLTSPHPAAPGIRVATRRFRACWATFCHVSSLATCSCSCNTIMKMSSQGPHCFGCWYGRWCWGQDCSGVCPAASGATSGQPPSRGLYSADHPAPWPRARPPHWRCPVR